MKTIATNTNEVVTIIAPVTVFDVTYSGDETSATVVFKFNEWNKDTKKEEEKTMSVMFFNNESTNHVARFKKLALTGKKVAIKYAEIDGRIYGRNIFLPNSAISAQYIDKNGEVKKVRVFFGYIRVGDNAMRTTRTGKKVFSFSMRSSVKPAGSSEYVTEWVNMSCWNEDGSPLADRAEKVLRNGDLVAVSFGPVKENVINEKTYKAASAYRFELVERAQVESNSESDATEAEPSASQVKSPTTKPAATTAPPQEKPATAAPQPAADMNSLFADEEDDDYPF